jgi:hypothetical protein
MSPELLALIEERGVTTILDEIRQYLEDKDAESFPGDSAYYDAYVSIEEAYDSLISEGIR